MDFVIAGLASGSGLAILGFLLREAGMSRRISMPAWLDPLGLVLMAAAVVAWCLTFASLVTDQPDSTATMLIAVGTGIAFLAGVFVLMRGGTRRPAMSKSKTPPGSIRVALPGSDNHAHPPTQKSPDVEDHAAVNASENREALARDRKDWESIWRETWGSGELPRGIASHENEDNNHSAEAIEEVRQTWSSGDPSHEVQNQDSTTPQAQPVLASGAMESSERSEPDDANAADLAEGNRPRS
ncbi:MAG: hypothetical protein AB7V46_03845 [Thermomicrobiales bacterium]